MNFFIFDFNKHLHLIDGFLEAAALAHKHEKKCKDWFFWKFRDNPYGQSIIACAEENDTITGCVAFGCQNFVYDSEVFLGALSFETFVHPLHQGKGLFKKLINNAEMEAKERGIRLLVNFPNSKSLPGFLKLNWSIIDNYEYYTKPKNFFKFLFYVLELKKSFRANNSNLKFLDKKSFENFCQDHHNGFYPQITKEYLNWRFLSQPNAEYLIINENNCFVVGRAGKRGRVNEIQLLFVSTKNRSSFSLNEIIKAIARKKSFDLISVPVSKNNFLRGFLRKNTFLKAPNKANVCYKIIDETLQVNFNKIEFSAINFHTY